MGRPSKLTPEVHARIVAAIAGGNTREAAAQAAEVSPRTLRYWLHKGETARNGSPCKALTAAVKEAENTAERASVAIIRNAADGGQLVSRKTTTRTLRDGTTIQTVDETYTRPEWTAAAWWLERRRADQWGKKEALEVTFRREAERIAQEVGMPVEEVIAEAERIVGAR